MSVNAFALIVAPLEAAVLAAQIRYVVTGSVAGVVYGEPRLTNDIDVVLDLAPASVPAFLACFPASEFYVPPEEVVEVEVRRAQRGHFNVIHHDTGFKGDFYPKGNDALQEWALAHPRVLDVDGVQMRVAPPEYVIVKKLEFFREGESRKHIDDIAAILRNPTLTLDHAILDNHVKRLGLSDQWQLAATQART